MERNHVLKSNMNMRMRGLNVKVLFQINISNHQNLITNHHAIGQVNLLFKEVRMRVYLN